MDPDIAPDLLAERLSIYYGRKFSETEMLPYAHAMLGLADDDPRRERLRLAILGAYEASEKGDFRLAARHDLELLLELFKLKQ